MPGRKSPLIVLMKPGNWSRRTRWREGKTERGCPMLDPGPGTTSKASYLETRVTITTQDSNPGLQRFVAWRIQLYGLDHVLTPAKRKMRFRAGMIQTASASEQKPAALRPFWEPTGIDGNRRESKIGSVPGWTVRLNKIHGVLKSFG